MYVYSQGSLEQRLTEAMSTSIQMVEMISLVVDFLGIYLDAQKLTTK